MSLIGEKWERKRSELTQAVRARRLFFLGERGALLGEDDLE